MELNLFHGRLIDFGTLITILFNLTLIILIFSEDSYFFNLFPNGIHSNTDFGENKFFNTDRIMRFHKFTKIFLSLNCLIFPLKIYSLLSWLKFLNSFNKLGSLIFRTLIGVSFYLLLGFIIIMSWSLGFYNFLRNYDERFNTYGNSLLNTILFNFRKMDLDEMEEISFAGNFFLISLFYFIINNGRILLMSYFIAILIYCIVLSSNLEFPSDEEANKINLLIHLAKRIEKFLKENMPHLETTSRYNSKQMLIWLNNGNLDNEVIKNVKVNCIELDIKLMVFENPHEVLQFLKYLFRLKPNLMYKSQNFFRIIIESSHLDLNCNYDKRDIEIILEFLFAIGSRVPLLLFAVREIKDDEIVKMKKIYKNLEVNYSQDNLKEFAFFKNINKENNKIVNQSEEESIKSYDTESDELNKS